MKKSISLSYFRQGFPQEISCILMKKQKNQFMNELLIKNNKNLFIYFSLIF